MIELPVRRRLGDVTPVVRTDYSDDEAWATVRRDMEAPSDEGFVAALEFLDSPDFDGLTPDQIRSSMPASHQGKLVFIVDSDAIGGPTHAVLVVDLHDPPHESFRATPRAVQAIQNNLPIANMDWEDFAVPAGRFGVFDGF